jgi:hypothetical protein
MTTLARINANRQNALLSTGPSTDGGKAVIAKNALKHGLRSNSPVVPGEKADEWSAFQAGIVESLNPIGALEHELAFRIASLYWRLRRVSRFETTATTTAMNRATNQLYDDHSPEAPRDQKDWLALLEAGINPRPRSVPTLERDLIEAREELDTSLWLAEYLPSLVGRPADEQVSGERGVGLLYTVAMTLPSTVDQEETFDDPGFLLSVGVPPEWMDEPEKWPGWSVVSVRVGVTELATINSIPESEAIERTIRRVERDIVKDRETVAARERELAVTKR